MSMEGRLSKETKFLTVVDTYAGYCQVCHEPRVVARIAVTGWEYHGTICCQCLTGLADEVERRGKALAVEKVCKTDSNGDTLAAILGSNGNGHAREPLGH
jgi:hypothetical protein